VVLYEARVGWEKPCGGGVPERATDSCPVLKDLALPRRLARRARIYSCSDREAVVPLAKPLRIFSRKDLNAHLLEKARSAGAEDRIARVSHLERDGRSWRIRDASGTIETFDFLVGADGAGGMVRGRVLGNGVAPLERTLGIGYYLDGYTSDEIILKFFPVSRGTSGSSRGPITWRWESALRQGAPGERLSGRRWDGSWWICTAPE